MTIYQEIRKERARQDAKWGGPDHDAEHDVIDWRDLIIEHAEKAADGYTAEKRRQRWIEVAALAVAAIEASDRRHVPTPSRKSKRGSKP